MKLWVSLVAVSLLYAAAVEYVIHRWVMHVPGLGRNAWWREHAVEHHGKQRNDVNIGLSPISVFALASPLLLAGCWAGGWWWVLYLVAMSCGYAGLWTALHSAYHETGCRWIARGWWFHRWRAHHMAHHDHPQHNYGTVFIWIDRLAGTHWRDAGSTRF